MLACDWVSPMLRTAHNLLKASGADGGDRRITSRYLCPQHSVNLGIQLLQSVTGTETWFDVGVNGLSMTHYQDQLEIVV